MVIATEKVQHSTHVSEFNAFKQLQLFETLKEQSFSGRLLIKTSDNIYWTFYLYLGRILYATGGLHAVRRWYRNVASHCPQLVLDSASLQADLQQISTPSEAWCWEYQLLRHWTSQQRISREQVVKIIGATVVEVLFDITQTGEIDYMLHPSGSLGKQLVLIDAEQAVQRAQKLWQAWQMAKVADRSPDRAPVIRHREALQQHTSEEVYTTFVRLLDGKRTLRDLAVRLQRNVVEITRSLLPYIQMGLVELVEVADRMAPIAPLGTTPSKLNVSSAGPLVACVDDSPVICHALEEILKNSGYQVIAVQDPIRALAVILERKPDLILLDLVMPNANGYEICSQLRKLSCFRQTPIVILTGNDGVIDRVRAKMVGATDFVSKPVHPGTVLTVLQKHLKASKVSG